MGIGRVSQAWEIESLSESNQFRDPTNIRDRPDIELELGKHTVPTQM